MHKIYIIWHYLTCLWLPCVPRAAPWKLHLSPVLACLSDLWKRALPPRRGIEPRSPAWQAGILTTILTRTGWFTTHYTSSIVSSIHGTCPHITCSCLWQISSGLVCWFIALKKQHSCQWQLLNNSHLFLFHRNFLNHSEDKMLSPPAHALCCLCKNNIQYW